MITVPLNNTYSIELGSDFPPFPILIHTHTGRRYALIESESQPVPWAYFIPGVFHTTCKALRIDGPSSFSWRIEHACEEEGGAVTFAVLYQDIVYTPTTYAHTVQQGRVRFEPMERRA